MPASSIRPVTSAGLIAGLLAMFFGAALATAAPAAALDDPSRPDARVTHGPSCHPGGLVVEVVAGTSPYSVRLATTRTPSGEDEANLQPGETVVLRTGDVAYGETIDGRLEFAAQDGTGVTYVDELRDYSFTRPTKEDCDAIAAPASPVPTTSGTPAPTATPTGTAPAPSSGATTSAPNTGSQPPLPAATVPSGGAGGGTGAREVTAGESVTVQGSGFLPGELVTFALNGSSDVLATATAGPDGTVQTAVPIPDGTVSGPATVHLFGTRSERLADVDLRVAAAAATVPADDDVATLVPLTAAALALVATVAGLVSVAGRQRTRRPTIRNA